MKKYLVIIALILAFAACTKPIKYQSYDDALANWTDYKDVGRWLDKNFRYSFKRKHSAMGGAVMKPETLYEMKTGYCADAAYLGMKALNEINPEYDAKMVFIFNGSGGSNHFATGFKLNSDIYVMDYGAGPGWRDMHGVHGPYESLAGYYRFLSSLSIKGFSPKFVSWDEGYRHTEDY